MSVTQTSPHVKFQLFLDDQDKVVYNQETLLKNLNHLVESIFPKTESNCVKQKQLNELENARKYITDPTLLFALENAIKGNCKSKEEVPYAITHTITDGKLQIDVTTDPSTYCFVEGKLTGALKIVKKYLELFQSDKLEEIKIEDGQLHANLLRFTIK